MSGICSAHYGHDPNCRICAASSPEEVLRAQAHAKSFDAGAQRGAEAVAEWLEGAQWDRAGQPCRSDAFDLVDPVTARKLAGLVRTRFAGGREPVVERLRSGTDHGVERVPGVCGGRAVLTGTRMPVWCLARLSVLHIRAFYPHLTQEQIEAAKRYASEHPEEIARDTRENACDG